MRPQTYRHISGVPWLIITGSAFDDWIYWRLLLQSLLITITTAHNQWLPKTRSIPYWTSVFSSIVTGLVLIYESVTWRTKNDLRINSHLPMNHDDWLNLSLVLPPTVSRPVCLGIKHPPRAYDQIFLLSDSCGFFDVERSDERTGMSFTNWHWSSPAKSFSGPSPVGLMTVLSCLRFETSLFIASYYLQGYGGGIRPRLHTEVWLNQLRVHLYNFGENRIQITTPNGSSTIQYLSVATETCINFVATLWFPQAYPLPRERA
jgi:hypothetical protein